MFSLNAHPASVALDPDGTIQKVRSIVLSEMEQRIYDKRDKVAAITNGDTKENVSDTDTTSRYTNHESFAVLSHGIQALQILHRPEKRSNSKAPASIAALRSNLKSELTMMIDRALVDELMRRRADGVRVLATAEDQSAPRLLHAFLSSLYEKMFHVLSCHAHILSEMRSTEEGRETLARANEDAACKCMF